MHYLILAFVNKNYKIWIVSGSDKTIIKII